MICHEFLCLMELPLPPLAPDSDAANLTSVSKVLSKILRHEPELVGIDLDAQGWAEIDTLLSRIARSARSLGATKRLRSLSPVTKEVLLQVVATNTKQRFAVSEDGARIRAVQGHSVEVDLGHPVLVPPTVLYHGTAAASLTAISREGLKPGSRHAVHLSGDSATARKVGARHGRPVVLVVAAERMRADGFAFSRSDNGVWLVDRVLPQYLSLDAR
jgi:putative RNA 2'-phosphotransferase